MFAAVEGLVMTSQATKDSMVGDGIDMSSVRIDYLDEIEASGADAGYRITALTRPRSK